MVSVTGDAAQPPRQAAPPFATRLCITSCLELTSSREDANPTSTKAQGQTKMSFGWSAGDVIAAINLLVKVAGALQEAGGASAEYQDAVGFLSTLRTTLEHLTSLDALSLEPRKAENLRRQCEQIRGPLRAFLDDATARFEASLGSAGRRSKVLTAPRKIQWALYTAKRVRRLQERIMVPMAAVNMLLGLQTM